MHIFAQSQTLSALANDDRANYDSSVSETGTLLILTNIGFRLILIRSKFKEIKEKSLHSGVH